MLTKTVKIRNSAGLHVRPAACLAEAARKYGCRVMLHYKGSDTNAISMINIMRTGIEDGETVEIYHDGDDENETIQTLVALFRDRFGKIE